MSSANPLSNPDVGYATSARCDGETIWVTLSTGATVADQVGRYAFLALAPIDARRDVQVVGRGIALRWPRLDEELGVNTILGVREEDVERAAGYAIENPTPSRSGTNRGP